MDNELNIPVSSTDLAEYLGLPRSGENIDFSRIQPLSLAGAGALCFSKTSCDTFPDGTLVIAPLGSASEAATILYSERPRLDFARALHWLQETVGFRCPDGLPILHPTVSVGLGCSFGPGVVIGAGTKIGNNVTVSAGAQIGERCTIKSNVVIGEDGFGFERDEQGIPIRLLHLGGVIIGNDVELGSFNTVCRGALTDTIIEDHVKTDDHVHIAHNVILRKCCLITACVELSGGVEVGERAWVGPNSSVIQHTKIGADALVGIASNIRKHVPEGMVVAGNPAKLLRKE